MRRTSVRERKYEVSIAKTTAIASGTKSDLAAPVMNTTGTKTMQMQSVETNAGVGDLLRAVEDGADDAASSAPCCGGCSRSRRSRRRRGCRPPAPCRRASSRSASVPSSESTMIETRIESGIETTTISVLRQLPRNSRIISAVSPAAMSASLTTPSIDGAHEHRLIEEQGDLELLGEPAPASWGGPRGRRRTTSSVLALPLLEDGHQHRAAGPRRAPCWSAASTRRARSPRRGRRRWCRCTVLIGMVARAPRAASGLALSDDGVLVGADLRACRWAGSRSAALIALFTSRGDRPQA